MKCVCFGCGEPKGTLHTFTCVNCCACGCIVSDTFLSGYCCNHDSAIKLKKRSLPPAAATASATDKVDRPEAWYDELASKGPQSKQARKASASFPVRSCNNQWKAEIIHSHAKRVRTNPSVLDLCCGRGGDLTKWRDIRPSMFYGCDISEASLEEALRRFTEFKIDCKPNFKKADMRKEKLPLPDNCVDMVSCQFALHYLVKTEASTHHILSEISRVLRDDGFFFATIPNEEVISPHLVAGGFQNSLCKIVPVKDNVNEYRFTLVDAVDDVEETLIHLQTFREIAELYYLEWDVDGIIIPKTDELPIDSRDVVNLYHAVSFKRKPRQ